MTEIVIDLETRSELNLKKVGPWEYSLHESTEVVCFGYKINDEPAKIFFPCFFELMPDDLKKALQGNFKLIAHNAFFERSMLLNCFNKNYDYNKAFEWDSKNYICTAAKARSHALPGNLEKACEALKLEVQKDKEGRKLMLRLCKPRKTWLTKKTGTKYFGTKEEFERLGKYCLTDVEAEYLLHKTLPNLSEYETKVWELDQKINVKGIRADVALCDSILTMIDKENFALKEEVTALTWGLVESATQRNEILKFVESEGLELPNLQARTIDLALKKGGMSEVAKRLLEIRRIVSRTSTAKYKRFIERANPKDLRVRDLLVYHGPSTGRWAGSGIQPQNFPRGIINDTLQAIEVVKEGGLEWTRLMYGDPIMAFSSILRGMLISSPGKELYLADYNAIETRVLWWLADHWKGLQLYKDGICTYCDQATEIYGWEVTKKHKPERQLGKKVVLGSGYGLGWKKFVKSCHDEDLLITDELGKKCIDSYRAKHKPVVELWSLLERGACFAVLNPTKKVRVKKVSFFMKGNFLYCELPSGRLLAYPFPSVRPTVTPWGEAKPTLFYYGVNSFTKQWEEESTWGGKLAENITQAVARDIMVHGMFNADDAGFDLLLTVHDEIASEKEIGASTVRDYENLLTDLPEWCKDLPMAAEGEVTLRYKK